MKSRSPITKTGDTAETLKIKKDYNKKERKTVWRTRFQLNNTEFRPVADTRRELLEMIDEIRAREHRTKYDLPTRTLSPSLRELFDKHLPTIQRKKQKVLATRVFKTFLALLPENIRITDLKRFHFQKYVDLRLSQNGVFTKTPVLPQTVGRELSCLGAALGKARDYFLELEDWKPPEIEKPKAKRVRRERLVSPAGELDVLLEHFRAKGNFANDRLADYLEFKYQTGLRRKEIFSLKKDQFDAHTQSLLNVRRWKTETVTSIYPLTRRASEIVEARTKAQKGSDWLFSPDGRPLESIYRSLRVACKRLGIAYGRYTEGGFVTHDLRHNFASEIVQNTDPETARELLGHSSLDQLGTYLHTDSRKMRDAVRRRENLDLLPEIVDLYKKVRRGRIKLREFVEKVRKIAEN